MKVKHLLVIVLLFGITAGALVFGFETKKPMEGPEFLDSFDGGKEHRLKDPAYAMVDGRGRIYVADSGNHRVTVLDSKGKYLYEIGGKESQKPLHYPYGLGLIGRDRLLVADVQAGTLQEFTTKGNFTRTWYSGDGFEPAGIYVSDDNKVYVSDISGKQILVFSEEGEMIQTIKPKEISLDGPQGIWGNRDGTLWVVDSANYNVKLLTENGDLKAVFDGGPESPLSAAKGLAVDDEGRIFVSDTLSNVIRIFDSEGNSLGSIGQIDGSEKNFLFPVGLFVDKDNRVYIADQGNNRIQVWRFN